MSEPELARRFWSKVDTGGSCWNWTGSLNKDGYGHFALTSRKIVLAHREAYQLAKGSIPTEMCVLHKCDNPRCVKPEHLFIGTQGDNIRDAFAKQRMSHIGERNGRAKITLRQANEIRKQRELGLSNAAQARIYGVCKSTIQMVVGHGTWG